MPDKAPYVPRHLGDAGRKLWRSILSELPGELQFDERELHELRQACEIEDQLAALRSVLDTEGMTATGSKGQAVIHPAVAESRQLRLVQHRLLRALSFDAPSDEPKTGHMNKRQRDQLRDARAARWAS
ncbi:MAG: P27 family phage terminase small subunit [Solirubrobacteraceae bacterium]